MISTRPRRAQARVSFDVERVRLDMATRGWVLRDLAARSGLCLDTVSRFLREQHRNPKTALAIARALRQPVSRYVRGAAEVEGRDAHR